MDILFYLLIGCTVLILYSIMTARLKMLKIISIIFGIFGVLWAAFCLPSALFMIRYKEGVRGVLSGLAPIFIFICVQIYVVKSEKRAKDRSKELKEQYKKMQIHTLEDYQQIIFSVKAKIEEQLHSLSLDFDHIDQTDSSLEMIGFADGVLYTHLNVQASGDNRNMLQYFMDLPSKQKELKYNETLAGIISKNPKNLPLVKEMNAFEEHVKTLKMWSQSAVQAKGYHAIKESQIAYYRVIGNKQYKYKVSGGGANLGGAVMGSVLAGDAGAVVGSKVGTQIKTEVHEDDQRRLFLYIYTGVENQLTAEEITTKNIDKMLELLRKLIPEKDYDHVIAMGIYSQQTRPVVPYSLNETTNSDNSKYSELKELKELLDLGIITQEEFEAKKQAILFQ